MEGFEETEVLSESCPECGENLMLGVEYLPDSKSIVIHYQLYCSQFDGGGCEFTQDEQEVGRVYRSKYNSFEDAKQEAFDRAYSHAIGSL